MHQVCVHDIHGHGEPITIGIQVRSRFYIWPYFASLVWYLYRSGCTTLTFCAFQYTYSRLSEIVDYAIRDNVLIQLGLFLIYLITSLLLNVWNLWIFYVKFVLLLNKLQTIRDFSINVANVLFCPLLLIK